MSKSATLNLVVSGDCPELSGYEPGDLVKLDLAEARTRDACTDLALDLGIKDPYAPSQCAFYPVVTPDGFYHPKTGDFIELNDSRRLFGEGEDQLFEAILQSVAEDQTKSCLIIFDYRH